jgi:hypothetical protein
MVHQCEVCERERRLGDEASVPPARSRFVAVEGRLLALCGRHAMQVLRAGVTTVEGVRALFQERTGGRSLVDRRSPLDRRMFPPRPEGRRLAYGRRSTDV